MITLSDYMNVEELYDMLRLYIHRLLLIYDETLQEEFWLVSEKMAQVCEVLIPFFSNQNANNCSKKFPEDYWLLRI